MSDKTGWICPKCGAVNAPSVQQCPCSHTVSPLRPAPVVVPVYPPPTQPYTGDPLPYPPNVWYSGGRA